MKFNDNLGEGFHAGLRKFCDSETSFDAYKIIRDMPDKSYSAFLNHIREQLAPHARPRSNNDFGDLLKKAVESCPTQVRLKRKLDGLQGWEWRNLADSIGWALEKA